MHRRFPAVQKDANESVLITTGHPQQDMPNGVHELARRIGRRWMQCEVLHASTSLQRVMIVVRDGLRIYLAWSVTSSKKH